HVPPRTLVRELRETPGRFGALRAPDLTPERARTAARHAYAALVIHGEQHRLTALRVREDRSPTSVRETAKQVRSVSDGPLTPTRTLADDAAGERKLAAAVKGLTAQEHELVDQLLTRHEAELVAGVVRQQ